MYQLLSLWPGLGDCSSMSWLALRRGEGAGRPLTVFFACFLARFVHHHLNNIRRACFFVRRTAGGNRRRAAIFLDPPHGIFLPLVGALVVIISRPGRVFRPSWPWSNSSVPVENLDLGDEAVVRFRSSIDRLAVRKLEDNEVRRVNQISREVRQFFWQVLANVIGHVSSRESSGAARLRLGPAARHGHLTVAFCAKPGDAEEALRSCENLSPNGGNGCHH